MTPSELGIDTAGPCRDLLGRVGTTTQISKPQVARGFAGSTTAEQLLARVVVQERVVQPQEAWRGEIAGYLYLGGLGAGAFLVAVLLEWFGFSLVPHDYSLGGLSVAWTPLLTYWGPLVTAMGASLLILHLGRNWFLFFTAGRNPGTSWLARGFSILSVFIVSATAILVLSMLVPEWIERHMIVWRVLQGIASMAAAGTAIYTGILLASMSYIPAWTVPLLAGRRLPLVPFLFLASAFSTGAVSLIIAAGVYRLVVKPDASATELSHVLEIAELLLIALEAALLILYLRRLRQAGPTAIVSADTLLRGSWRLPFWLGVVGCALALPFILHLVNVIQESEAVGLVAALSVLVGGFFLRLGILSVGIKERPPLYRLSEWRGRALDARV